MAALSVGILDLCKRSAQRSAGETIEGTLSLAEEADRLGYHRYWIAEHHVEDTAEACPEVLIPLIAARTRRMKVGSGGVLLRYYAPLKVAETFLTLEALFPGRIELGVAKGPGVVSPATAEALVSGNRWELSEEAFERKVFELKAFLSHALEPAAQTASPRARPWGVPPPPLWVLGSGPRSKELAVDVSTSYACSLFFDPGGALTPGLLADYQARSSGQTCVAVSVVCCETEKAAQARNEALMAAGMFQSNVVGTPEQCAARFDSLAKAHGTQDLLLASWIDDPHERRVMFRQLAEACRLS